VVAHRLGGEVGRVGTAQVGECDVEALARERGADRSTDAATAARDESKRGGTGGFNATFILLFFGFFGCYGCLLAVRFSAPAVSQLVRQ
jgi:hypothetical protein